MTHGSDFVVSISLSGCSLQVHTGSEELRALSWKRYWMFGVGIGKLLVTLLVRVREKR